MTQDKNGAGGQTSSSETPSSPARTASNHDACSRAASSAPAKRSIWQWIRHVIFWVPPNCRWDPQNPPKFTMALNFLFAFAGAFTVANLYYNHPVLNIIAHDFGVTYVQVSSIPTVMQAGYAAGLLFLCPLADMVQRRPFVVGLMFFTATVWIGLCVTSSVSVFIALSFICGATTVTPQLMLPLVGELAPANRKGLFLSITTSGLMLGLLIARVLSGTITEYVSWRVVYWMALGLQYLMSILLWLFMPDYPSLNTDKKFTAANYCKLLWSIITLLFRQPTLLQSCLISLFTSATFTNFWTTLTFLLAGPPYHLNSLVIGLFALIGIGAMIANPIFGRLVTDRFVPWFSVVVGETIALTGIIIGTYTGTFTLVGPILQAFLFDLGFQSAQVANRASIYAIAPRARNRVNTAFMVFTFCGQLIGTAVGNQVYARKGWVHSGSVSVGFVCISLLFCFVRGPWEKGWVGWNGGFGIRPRPKEEDAVAQAEARNEGVEAFDGSSDPEKGNTEKALEEMAGEDGSPGRDEDEITRDLESDAEKRSGVSEKSVLGGSSERKEGDLEAKLEKY